MNALKPVDHAALRTNQAAIIIVLITAFIINAPLLVALVALFMLGGSLLNRPGFAFIYTRLLRPLGWVKPDVIPDNPEPHRFAQAFGGTFVLASFLFLVASLSTVAWALAWIVIALAALNLFAGFCTGCAIYYWLNRLQVPGFLKSPPAGTFPGLRPRHPDTTAQENLS